MKDEENFFVGDVGNLAEFLGAFSQACGVEEERIALTPTLALEVKESPVLISYHQYRRGDARWEFEVVWGGRELGERSIGEVLQLLAQRLGVEVFAPENDATCRKYDASGGASYVSVVYPAEYGEEGLRVTSMGDS